MCRDLTTRVPRVDADKGLVDCYNVSPIWLVLVIIIQTTVHVMQEFTHNLLSAVHWQWFDDWSNSFEYWKNAFQELELFCKEDEHFIKYLLLMHYHRTPSVYPSKIFTVNSLPYDSLCVTPFLVWINLWSLPSAVPPPTFWWIYNLLGLFLASDLFMLTVLTQSLAVYSNWLSFYW